MMSLGPSCNTLSIRTKFVSALLKPLCVATATACTELQRCKRHVCHARLINKALKLYYYIPFIVSGNAQCPTDEHLYHELHNETSYRTVMYYFLLFFRYPVISFLVYLKQMVRFVLFYFCPKTNTLVKPYRIFNYDLFNEFQYF